jgi:serine-type D-Ala-D-Ala carboxypeptidase/endopeptidase
MRQRTNRMAFIAIILFIFFGVASFASGPRGKEIRTAIRSRVDAGKSVGMVVATLDANGATSIEAYGDAGPGALPLDADSVFEIGSITKVFTAILLADMVDRGEVHYDDPVSLYLPSSVRVPERNGRKITLVDLSTQSSGLPRMPGNMRPRDPANPYADYTSEQLFEFLNRYELTRDIGAQYEYSNLGVALLGQALARKAGKSYEALVQERIVKPLRMEHTGVTLTPWMQKHLAIGHDAQKRIASNWDLPAFAGAGALRSTMNDMLVFAKANLTPSAGRLQRVMQQTHQARKAAGGPTMSIGLGWHIRHLDGRDVVGHNGGTSGYRTWIGFDKARKVAAIVLTNSQLANDDLGLQLVTAGGPATGL